MPVAMGASPWEKQTHGNTRPDNHILNAQRIGVWGADTATPGSAIPGYQHIAGYAAGRVLYYLQCYQHVMPTAFL